MTSLSYACGISDKPLLFQTIGAALEDAARRWGGREALVIPHQDIRWSYGELLARVDAFAAGLVALGLRPGDRVGVWSPNNAEWVIAQFATARAGLIQVNINPAYRLGELEYALNKVGCRALIMAQSFRTSDYVAMVRDLAPELDRAEELVPLWQYRFADPDPYREPKSSRNNGGIPIDDVVKSMAMPATTAAILKWCISAPGN